MKRICSTSTVYLYYLEVFFVVYWNKIQYNLVIPHHFESTTLKLCSWLSGVRKLEKHFRVVKAIRGFYQIISFIQVNILGDTVISRQLTNSVTFLPMTVQGLTHGNLYATISLPKFSLFIKNSLFLTYLKSFIFKPPVFYFKTVIKLIKIVKSIKIHPLNPTTHVLPLP